MLYHCHFEWNQCDDDDDDDVTRRGQIGQDVVIDRAIGQFHKRLLLVVATGGGHIEHRFD